MTTYFNDIKKEKFTRKFTCIAFCSNNQSKHFYLSVLEFRNQWKILNIVNKKRQISLQYHTRLYQDQDSIEFYKILIKYKNNILYTHKWHNSLVFIDIIDYGY